MKKQITLETVAGMIEDLAVSTKRGFDEVYERFDQIDKRFEQVDKRFNQIDQRFDRVEFLMGGHERRLEMLEDKMRIVQTKLKFS